MPPAVELSCSRRSSYVRHCRCFLSHRCLCTCDFNLSYSFIDPPMFVIEAMNWYHCLCMWWFLLDSRTNAYVFGDYIVSLFLRSWNYHGIQPWMHSRSCQPCVCGNAPVSVLELHTRCLCNYPRETWSFTLFCQAIFQNLFVSYWCSNEDIKCRISCKSTTSGYAHASIVVLLKCMLS